MEDSKLDLKVYPKTVYTDIVNMPDPMLLGLTVHYYNFSDITLYMKLLISGPSPWSSNAQTLGSLGSGLNTYINIDNFTSRSKPSNATTEVLTVTLEAYSDSGYSNLMYTFSRSLTVVFIKSDDGTWTTDYGDNFDEGTIDGWAYAKEVDNGGDYALNITTDYILSTPYSLKFGWSLYNSGPNSDYEYRVRVYKSFTTPNKGTVYAIFNIRDYSNDLRPASLAGSFLKYLQLKSNDTVLVYLGRSYDTVQANYIPINKWMRIVVPLPSNTTVELRMILDWYYYNHDDYLNWCYASLWLDDFKIISK